MMFDAPGSQTNPLVLGLALSVVTFSVFCFLGAALPWILRKRPFARAFFLLPLICLVLIAVCFFALDYFCAGQFYCHVNYLGSPD
jgi:ABC-type transport system involved in cytochrome c biogenesis permease component